MFLISAHDRHLSGGDGHGAAAADQAEGPCHTAHTGKARTAPAWAGPSATGEEVVVAPGRGSEAASGPGEGAGEEALTPGAVVEVRPALQALFQVPLVPSCRLEVVQ